MWATSVPILVFQGLSVLDLGPTNATDRRQTDVRRASSLRGMGITIGILTPYKIETLEQIDSKFVKVS